MRLNGLLPPLPIGQLEAGSSRTVTLTAELAVAAAYRSFVILRVGKEVAYRRQPGGRAHAVIRADRGDQPSGRDHFDLLERRGCRIRDDGDPSLAARSLSIGRCCKASRIRRRPTAPCYRTRHRLCSSPCSLPEIGRQPVTVALELTGIERAGRYDAIVRLRGDGYSGKDLTLTVDAREHFGVALFWIALEAATDSYCALMAAWPGRDCSTSAGWRRSSPSCNCWPSW